MVLTMVILAAGMGSRFGGPKQLVPVGPSGESILDYNAHDAIEAGFERLVVVTRSELESAVREVLDRGASRRSSVEVVLQEIPPGRSKPLGTADAVRTASGCVNGPFGVANADDLYGPGAFAVLARSLAQGLSDGRGDEGFVVGFPLEATVPPQGAVSRAVLRVNAGGLLVDLVEVHGVERTQGRWRPESVPGIGPLRGDEPVSTNLWGLPLWAMEAMAAAVDAFVARGADGEVYLPAVVGDLVGTGKLAVRVLHTDEPWAGMTNPSDIDIVRAHTTRRWPSPLW